MPESHISQTQINEGAVAGTTKCALEVLDRYGVEEKLKDIRLACGQAGCYLVGFNDSDNITVSNNTTCQTIVRTNNSYTANNSLLQVAS